MPVYHSTLNGVASPVVCGSALLPLKTKVKGPAAQCPAGSTDIIDEAIAFFRANVLYRNFACNGGADLTLAYLTVFIGELLRAFAKSKTRDEAKRGLTTISMNNNFAVPGEKNFCLPGFFTAPTNKADADAFRAYYRQLREETANRLVEVAFKADGAQNKWWIAFAKRKFMNIAQT